MLDELQVKSLSEKTSAKLKAIIDEAFNFYEKSLKLKRIKQALLSKYF